MKHKLTLYSWMTAVIAGLAMATCGSLCYGASDIIFGPQGTEASISNPDGTWIHMWGNAFVNTTFDAAHPPPSGDTAGAAYNQGDWTGSGANAWDDYNMISGNTWWGGLTFNASQYSSIEMDIKYDTTSTMTPTSAAHLGVGFDSYYSFTQVTNLSFDTASSILADGNWHHLSIAIPLTLSINNPPNPPDGVSYYQWNPVGTTGTMNYWMANVRLVARIVPVAPPTMVSLTKPVAGLNIFASSEGNSYYDRQDAMLKLTNGESWFGQASGAHPVTYSFTINSFPTTGTNSAEAYLFLVPNPAANDNAPDWNETNVVIATIQQSSPTNTIMTFQYKVNEDHNQLMYTGAAPYTNAPGSWNGVTPGYLESGNLGSVTNQGGGVGTWSIKFTSNTNVTLIAPNATNTCVIPPYNASYFQEVSGFDVYLGMQANNAPAINTAVVYSSFSITGSVNPFSDNFLTDTVLNTNNWDTSEANSPKTVLVVPSTAAYWLRWTIPANGYVLETGASLTNFSNWTTPSMYSAENLFGEQQQLVDSTELPAGKNAFFNMVEYSFTQMQVLLPGETNAPGTVSGKTGTPTLPVTAGLTYVYVTVNAVDSSYHIVHGVLGDTIALTNPDTTGTTPVDASLAGGTVTFGPLLFNTPGSYAITATDISNTNIPTALSSSVTVTP
jgi:hypothetical protein